MSEDKLGFLIKTERMLKERRFWVVLVLVLGILETSFYTVTSLPHRILLDTDVDTDDLSALLYLLKLNRSEFKLEGVTINTNAWSNAGHAVNQVYDVLYMMGRDDIAVGMGGEGGILEDGTILPNVGGFLPIIDQGKTTNGGCRYRQAIPKGLQGRLVADTNFGIRKQFLPQGSRRYSPLRQPTAQQVIIEKVSQGPISVFLIGSHTNFALFFMRNPHLKKHVEHVYVMGGAIRSRNPTGCCPKNSRGACKPRQCGTLGNLFPDYTSNPYAEYNIFADPFAAYQVFHSGVPVTLVPLDATNTIPINKKFFKTFERNQETYEAQFTFLSLKTARTWYDEQFYTSYFMWDSFTAGVAISIMRNSGKKKGKNDFAVMKYMNLTVITSNKPYDASDGSNPFFDNRKVPKFNLKKCGVHSGHVQTGLRDPFCISKKGKGKCRDGYTEETSGSDSVRVLVARKAKPNKDGRSELDKEFYVSYLKVMNWREQAGKFNFSSQFPYYKEKLYRPVYGNRQLGKPVVFDMDMSAGDFLSLLYLLKVPVEIINLKAIIVSPTGWANAATIDVVYDLLHMMGRDDVPVGLGDMFALNQSDKIFPAVGNCKYVKAIPQGSGGLLDSDTLYGLARDLPRSPRRYSAENSERRQPLAVEVWDNVVKSLDPGSKITVLTNGPLTNLANIVSSTKNATSVIQDVYVVGGLVSRNNTDRGNVFTVVANKHAEFNFFLDPLAARTVLESDMSITLIPLGTQRKFSSFKIMLKSFLQTEKKTPEARFARRLLSRLYLLQQTHHRYLHMDTFLGEILGAVLLGGDHSVLKPTLNTERVKVIAEGDETRDGRILIDRSDGKHVKVLKSVDSSEYYSLFSSRLNDKKQSAVIGSFEEQRKRWNTPPDPTQVSQSGL